MMEHPLIEIDPSLDINKITEIISDLQKKIMFSVRTNNTSLTHQLNLALNSYQARYKELLNQKPSGDQEDYHDRIDIS